MQDFSSVNRLSELVIGLAIEVHRELGPGLLESVYLMCMCYELTKSGTQFKKEFPIPIAYKELKLSTSYRLDLLIADQLVVEIKNVELLLPVHKAQLMTYMKICGAPCGLLLNFNVAVMKDGIRRAVL